MKQLILLIFVCSLGTNYIATHLVSLKRDGHMAQIDTDILNAQAFENFIEDGTIVPDLFSPNQISYIWWLYDFRWINPSSYQETLTQLDSVQFKESLLMIDLLKMMDLMWIWLDFLVKVSIANPAQYELNLEFLREVSQLSTPIEGYLMGALRTSFLHDSLGIAIQSQRPLSEEPSGLKKTRTVTSRFYQACILDNGQLIINNLRDFKHNDTFYLEIVPEHLLFTPKNDFLIIVAQNTLHIWRHFDAKIVMRIVFNTALSDISVDADQQKFTVIHGSVAESFSMPSQHILDSICNCSLEEIFLLATLAHAEKHEQIKLLANSRFKERYEKSRTTVKMLYRR